MQEDEKRQYIIIYIYIYEFIYIYIYIYNMSCCSWAPCIWPQLLHAVGISPLFQTISGAKEETHRCQSHASFKSLSFKAWDLDFHRSDSIQPGGSRTPREENDGPRIYHD